MPRRPVEVQSRPENTMPPPSCSAPFPLRIERIKVAAIPNGLFFRVGCDIWFDCFTYPIILSQVVDFPVTTAPMDTHIEITPCYSIHSCRATVTFSNCVVVLVRDVIFPDIPRRRAPSIVPTPPPHATQSYAGFGDTVTQYITGNSTWAYAEPSPDYPVL